MSYTIDDSQYPSQESVDISLGNQASIDSGASLEISISSILMPPSLCSISGITVSSCDSNFYVLEQATYTTITNTLPGNENTSTSSSLVTMLTSTGILDINQVY